MAGLHHFQTLIAAENRLFVAADGRVYAFAFDYPLVRQRSPPEALKKHALFQTSIVATINSSPNSRHCPGSHTRTGGGSKEAMAGLHHFQTLIPAENRLFVAADGRVYAASATALARVLLQQSGVARRRSKTT
jgi:hypothetical protein